MLWIFEGIFLSLEFVHGSNCKSILTQKPVEVHCCPVSDSDRSVLPAPQCYIIAINETFFPPYVRKCLVLNLCLQFSLVYLT